jgi:HlyD family secretion protein
MDLQNIKKKLLGFYNKNKRLVWIIAAALLILVIGLVIFIPKQDAATEDVQYVQVSRGSITESIGEVGYVEAQPSASINWSYGGIVGEHDLKVGDHIKKDDVLMELDFSSWPNESLQAQSDLLDAQLAYENMTSSDSDFQAALQAVADAEYKVRTTKDMRDFWNFGSSSDERIDAIREKYLSAEWDVRVLEAEYETLRNTLEEDDPALIAAFEAFQAANLEGDSYLRALNQILGHSYDQVVATDFNDYDQAKAELLQVRAEYERLLDNSQELAAAKANVQAIQNMINKAKIIAPFDGTITEISYQPGEFVETGSLAVQIDDLENLIVDVDVSEVDISKVEIGQSVAITFDALPYREYSGFVSTISSAGMDKNSIIKFRVTVNIEDADKSVKPGFTAVVSIITSQAEEALLVPNQALRNINGNYSVVVSGADGAPMPVRVEVGATSEAFTEIISGEITEGDQLIVMVNTNTSGFGGGGSGMLGGVGQITGGGGGGRSQDQSK